MLLGLGSAHGVFISMCMYFFGATWFLSLSALHVRVQHVRCHRLRECLVSTLPLVDLLAGRPVVAGLAMWLTYMETSGQLMEVTAAVGTHTPILT
ncbi:hypothetical protein K438DRAFT_857401 [Mycena galopus ATCC 62051]|nr:hypothetical protein K438DRAFT_857401 [Mycena galopus ATCC 62051]